MNKSSETCLGMAGILLSWAAHTALLTLLDITPSWKLVALEAGGVMLLLALALGLYDLGIRLEARRNRKWQERQRREWEARHG